MKDSEHTGTKLDIIFKPNQIHRELEGIIGLNAFRAHNSASRVQMNGSHIGQCLSIRGGDIQYPQTGMMREYAKYTFSIKAPATGEVISVIDRYRPQAGVDTISKNPQRVVIYEDFETHEIGCVSIVDYCSHHSYFGFEYVKKPIVNQLRPGFPLKKDTILADSPAVTDNGDYKPGINLNICYATLPGTSEDGAIVSSDILPKLAFKIYERRSFEWGAKFFPLNLYGDEKTYKPFPDIGDWVDESGLVVALREYDPELALVQQSVLDCREVDYTFDRRLYAVPGQRGKVVDVKVHHDLRNVHGRTPLGMEGQNVKYDNARRQFYREILDQYQALKRKRGDALRLTPQFHHLVKEAISVVGETKDHIHLLFKRTPMDDWRVEIVIEYEIIPREGFKITDMHGGKAVICKVVPPEHMPVDINGVRADVIMDPGGTVNRNNCGRLYEQFYNSVSADILRRLRNDLGIMAGQKNILQHIEAIERVDPDRVKRAIDYLMGYYKILTPFQYADMMSGTYTAPLTHHLAYVLEASTNGIHMFIPLENPPEPEWIVQELRKHYNPTLGPVTYVGNSGNRVTTKRPARIGSVYILLLEKIADDWTATSSGKLQHLGVLSQVTNWDKNSQPSHNQAIRAHGESEVRIEISYMGQLATVEIHDRNNNPLTHKEVLNAILSAEKPTNIPLAVDREQIPFGMSRPLQLAKHILDTSGIMFTYKPQGLEDFEAERLAFMQKLAAEGPPTPREERQVVCSVATKREINNGSGPIAPPSQIDDAIDEHHRMEEG